MLRYLRASALLTICALALAACSEQLDQGLNNVAADALEQAVTQQLEAAGITLESGPDCQTDLTRDGSALSGDADCEAVAIDGRPVRAEFDGTLSTSGCTGSLGVFVGDTSVAQLDEIPNCSVSL